MSRVKLDDVTCPTCKKMVLFSETTSTGIITSITKTNNIWEIRKQFVKCPKCGNHMDIVWRESSIW